MPELGTRLLKLEVAGTDFSDSVSTVEILSGDADAGFVSFASAASNQGKEYKIHMVLKQDTSSTSLWYYIWAHAGEEVAIVVRPNSGTAAGASTPQFLATAVVSEPDGVLLGGDANKSTSARFTAEVEWSLLARPTLDITP